MAYVETGVATGSGILIEGGYVITNAHVVWTHNTARVVFPDGSEHEDAPVTHVDLLADLAIIGPLDTELEPLEFGDGEALPIASNVYLIGYPAELENENVKPTITRGILSRLRQSGSVGVTYLQTDTAIAGGQSGGPLFSEDGYVIGMSTFALASFTFALNSSVTDISEKVQALLNEDPSAAPVNRRVTLEGARTRYNFSLDNLWDATTFVISEPVGTEVDISINSENDVNFTVVNPRRTKVLSVDSRKTGAESGSFKVGYDGPYFLTVGQSTKGPARVNLNSSVAISLYKDVDDGQSVSAGQTVTGAVEFPADQDYFIIDMVEGDSIDILVEAVLMDPYVVVHWLSGSYPEQWIADDDSGVGVFGWDAKLTFEAPHSGNFYILVRDVFDNRVGGYVLSVSETPPPAS